jgi:MoaA/NifB/PqqE/SkfB family radical SAM enzyme
MGKDLCILNLKRREAWIYSGSSLQMWRRLSEGAAPDEIAGAFSAKYNIPAEKIRRDVERFVEHLWTRGIVEIPGREHISDDERAAIVGEEPHNKSGKMYEAALNAQVMFRCTFDLLIPCNLRCRHCYLDFSEKDIMPFETVCNYLDQLADHGCPEIALTGGEIFLRRDLMDIVAYAESKGFLMDLLTNGNFINKDKADQLARHYVQAVQISIYGTTPELHEAVTMKAGTYDESITAARLLIERGIPVRLAYFIQQHNFEDAFKFAEFATAMGANYAFDTKLVPNRNGSTELLRHAVSLQQQAELYKSGLLTRETKFVCTAAVSKARITARGDVFPCELINTATMGNLRDQTLAQIWASQHRQELRQAILGYKPNRCGGCGHTSDCEPCAAMRGFNQEGHMEAPVSEACLMTTASLLSKGKHLDANSPFRQFADDCVSSILSQEAIPAARGSLVQIMRSRASGTSL